MRVNVFFLYSSTENAEESSSEESDEDDDEDDLIGRKGKAPNQLLMEVHIQAREGD